MHNAPDRCTQAGRGVRVLHGLFPAWLLISVAANAATFEERVNHANAAFETDQGEAYDRKLVPLIQQAVSECAPAGSTSKEDFGKFVLVADVSAEGKLLNPRVRPETKTAFCFAQKLGDQLLPAPPGSIISDGFAPIVVEVYIVP